MVEFVSLLKVSLTLGCLEFITSMIASIFIALLAKYQTWCKILGVLLIIGALVLIVFGFIKNEDISLRINHLTVGIPSLIIGCTTIFLKEHWFCTAAVLTRAIIFALIAFAIIGMLCFLYPILTGLVFRDVLDGASLNRTNELTIYIWTNFFLCFFYGLILGSPTTLEIGKIYNKMIQYGVANWFIGFIMFALLGLLINSKNTGSNKGLYDSANLNSQPVE